MTMQIPPKDQKLLCAYIDGELSHRKQLRLEARLEKEPELQRELGELQRTRKLLQAMPRLKAPKNFTLKAEMAKQAGTIQRNYSFSFRLVSATAGLMLILVLVIDFIGLPSWMGRLVEIPQTAAIQEVWDEEMPFEEAPSLGAPAEKSVGEGSQLEEDKAANDLSEAIELPPTDYAEAEPSESFGAAEMAPEEGGAESAVEEQQDEHTLLLREYEAFDEVPPPEAEEAPLMLEVQPTGSPVPESLAEDQREMPMAAGDGQFDSTGTAVTAGANQAEATELLADQSPSEEVIAIQDKPIFLSIEIALGVIAIGAGVLALYFSRAGRDAG